MHSNNKSWIVYTILIIVIISITYMQVTIYIPIKNIVKIEKMVEPDSKIKIINSVTNKIVDVSSERFRVKIHNLFNDLKLSRDFFISKLQMSLPSDIIELQYINIDNKEITSTVVIFSNGNISINGEMFKASNNIYNESRNIITVGN